MIGATGATWMTLAVWTTPARAALPAMSAMAAMRMVAAPFAGTGHAAIGGEVDGLRARDQALERARKAALEAAIQQLGAVDPAARKQVLAAPNVWTRSYRVLRQDDDGATATAVVSVEIDTARLAKTLGGPGAASTSGAGPGIVVLPGLDLESSGCPASLEAEVKRTLVGVGLVRDVGPGSAGPVLAATLKCTDLGMVAYPRQAAVKALLALQPPGSAGTPGSGRMAFEATGFGEDRQAAAGDAWTGPGGLAGKVTRTLSTHDNTGVRLRISTPWPAARVRRLERALRDSVVGVQAVTVAGVGSDGAVTLRIDGALTAPELHARLAAVQVPGVTLILGEVISNVVQVSLQSQASTPAPAL